MSQWYFATIVNELTVGFTLSKAHLRVVKYNTTIPVYTSSAARYPTGKASIPLWIRSIAREFTNARFVNMLCVANNATQHLHKEPDTPQREEGVCVTG